MIVLRDYQKDIIDKVRTALTRAPSTLLCLSTGAGKTLLAAFMQGTARERGHTSWFIAHRDFLLDQTASTFDRLGIPYGFIAAGRPYNPHHAIQIVSIATAQRRLDRLPVPDIVVWDECHHLASTSYRKVYAWAPRARHIGLSATPTRLDGNGLDEFFASIVHGPSMSWLMQHGYLSEYRAFAPSAPDVSGVHTIAGDYNRGELGHVMDDGQIIGDMVRHYREKADGKRAVYFAVSVEHSKHIAATFTSRGITAEHLDASHSAEQRRSAASRFSNGRTQILSSVDLFGEGFDIAAYAGTDVSVEAVGLGRPTKSLSLHLQQIGRALRPKDTPAIILDHAGNLLRHGLPDDDRIWSLKGIDKRTSKAAGGPAVTQCRSCFGVYTLGRLACPYCNATRAVECRAIEEINGELREIDRAAMAARETDRKQRERTEQEAARTMAELVQLGKRRGYKAPSWWAMKVMDGRRKHA